MLEAEEDQVSPPATTIVDLQGDPPPVAGPGPGGQGPEEEQDNQVSPPATTIVDLHEDAPPVAGPGPGPGGQSPEEEEEEEEGAEGDHPPLITPTQRSNDGPPPAAPQPAENRWVTALDQFKMKRFFVLRVKATKTQKKAINHL